MDLDKYPLIEPPQTTDEFLHVCGAPPYVEDPVKPGFVILDPEWASEMLVLERFPILGQRLCNRLMVRPLHAALLEIEQSKYKDFFDDRACGIFCARHIGRDPKKPLSLHTVAMAVDLDWIANPYGKLGKIRQVPWLITTMKSHGFIWGGDFSTPDDMHWQFGGMRVVIR